MIDINVFPTSYLSVVDRISKTTLFYPCLCDMELMKNNEIEYNRHRQTKSLFLVRTTVVSKCQKFVPLKKCHCNGGRNSESIFRGTHCNKTNNRLMWVTKHPFFQLSKGVAQLKFKKILVRYVSSQLL